MTVTAQRREERVIDVPLSIEAVSASDLDKSGTTDLRGLQNMTPGLVVSSGYGRTNTFIRGVGNSVLSLGAESSVASFIDDVPRTRVFFSTQLVNVERVEVLKGPQGALYGRNATGGAINIVTHQPGSEPEATIRVTGGNYSRADVSAYGNTPLSDTVTINGSFNRSYHKAYVTNRAPGGAKLDALDSKGGDIKLKYAPSDKLDFTLSADFFSAEDTYGFSFVQQNLPQTQAFLNSIWTAFGNAPPIPTLTAGNNESTYGFGPVGREMKDYGGSLRARWQLDGGSEFVSLSAYRKIDAPRAVFDTSSVSYPVYTNMNGQKGTSAYQEFRLLSPTTDRLSWLASATYLHDEAEVATNAIFLLRQVNSLGRREQEIDSYAVVGQLGYDVTDALELIGAVRFSKEEKKTIFPAQTLDPPLGAQARFESSIEEDSTSPSLTANYRLSPDSIIYGRYARGYKTGGINENINPVNLGGTVNAFGPEKIDGLEIGYKADFPQAGLRLTSALFYNDYRDLQVNVFGVGQSFVLNAPKARTYGAELELAWRATDSLQITGNGGYLNSNYTDFNFIGVTVAQGTPLQFTITDFDASNNQMANAPEVSLGLAFDFERPISSQLALKASANAAYRSSFFLDQSMTPTAKIDSYTVANASLGIETLDERYSLTAFVNNIGDESYPSFGTVSTIGTVVHYSDPRTYGATFQVRF